MKYWFVLLVLTPLLSLAQMKKEGSGVAPGMAGVFGKEKGFNTRFYFFPNHKICFGPEVNFFPRKDHDLSDGMEVSFNGHYIFELSERWGIYPLAGIGWKNEEEESGWRGNFGSGLHGSYGRFAPYIEYIYSAGFENEGIFLIGTFFTFEFDKE